MSNGSIIINHLEILSSPILLIILILVKYLVQLLHLSIHTTFDPTQIPYLHCKQFVKRPTKIDEGYVQHRRESMETRLRWKKKESSSKCKEKETVLVPVPMPEMRRLSVSDAKMLSLTSPSPMHDACFIKSRVFDLPQGMITTGRQGVKFTPGRKSTSHIDDSVMDVETDVVAVLGVKVIAADMPPFMQLHAVQCARRIHDGMERFSPRQMAHDLKKEFDKVYGPIWHCIVGTSFGSFVTHATGCFLYFSMEKLLVMLFKTKIRNVITS